jgi:hypothetical protein
MQPTRTRFGKLSIGQHFRFASEMDFPFSGMKRGECIKLSTRRYRYVEDGLESRVGSVNVQVMRLQRR